MWPCTLVIPIPGQTRQERLRATKSAQQNPIKGAGELQRESQSKTKGRWLILIWSCYTWDKSSHCNFLGSLSIWPTRSTYATMKNKLGHDGYNRGPQNWAKSETRPIHKQKEQIGAHWISNSAQLHSSSSSLGKTPSLHSALASASSSNCVLSTLALGYSEHSTMSCTWCMGGMQLTAASDSMTSASSGLSLLFWGTQKAEKSGSVFLSRYTCYPNTLKHSQDDQPSQFD